MDISVLPNNNHPEKFLQLDVRILPVTHGMFHAGSAMSSQRHWQNRVYSQREPRIKSEKRSLPFPDGVVFVDRYLEKHITPFTVKSNIKRNPLYTDLRSMDKVDMEKSKPSWTVREYCTQTIHGNLTNFLKEEEKTAKDMDFWLEDLYTPGFDSLLKKKEAEHKRKKNCKIFFSIILSLCAILIVIIVPVVVFQKKN
ncbi:major intrinsically disordered NOTCH2-binding receptor 1-like [Platichthys flesus]|uniref:major intrinsically disordered NOTCH2-binding receptor 1-like n=1 Tax=Platichthys flesus TaxID=8260 RepID=UPI002DBA15FD|nr:major intrinsically disordered NOTCH2-binding receptor 1-like [Platichthys flesus]